MRKWLWILFMMISGVSQAKDGAILGVVLDKVNAKQWENAEAFAKHADDPMVQEILDWYALRSGRGQLEDYEKFLTENSDWPGLPWLQGYGENILPKDTDPERVVAFIEHQGPQTAHGLAAYIKALVALDRKRDALKAFDDAKEEIVISFAEFQNIQEHMSAITQKDMIAQVHYLLDKKKVTDAEDYLDALPENAREIVDARLALIDNKIDKDEWLTTLSEAALASPELTFERFRHAFENGDRPQASEIMLEASKGKLYRPALWMENDMRTRLAGDALWAGDGKRAYDLVAQHNIDDQDEGYALAEWTAGFIALDFLSKPKVARKHFQNFKSSVATPISNGRAGYWLGRSGDPEGYAYGAQFQASFYGQLSAEMAGVPFDQNLIDAPKPEVTNKLLVRDSVHAGLLFYSADEPLLAHRFFAHEAETATPEEAEALGILAVRLGIPHGAINIGKNLAQRGETITHSIFPIPDIYPEELAAPKPLALAVTRQESEFYQRAESHVGAKGFMQLMPATAAHVAERIGLEFDENALKENGYYNVTLGAAYLDELGLEFANNPIYMAAGYNAGPHRVREWRLHVGEAGPTIEDAVHWIEMIRFEETRNYVQRVLEGTFVYDAKLNGSFRIKPSDLLLKPYN